MSAVKDYILENWKNTIRFNPEDEGTRIGLPKPYTVPSISDNFQEMYYWDTYFINRGLMISGLTEQAVNNVENMLYLVERYGFMPNGNRTFYLNNSQPPFLSLMVKDVYKMTGDKDWLKKAVATLEKEYAFWDTARNTEIGLNRYSCNKAGAIKRNAYADFIGRIGKRPEGYTDDSLSCQYMTINESGWDITPRFGFETENYVQADLNALMFAFEENMARFYEELGKPGFEVWKEKANRRKELMNRYMCKDGIFYDYNFKTGKISDMFTCASFYPMFAEMVTDSQAKALADNLYRLEAEYGVTVNESKDDTYHYQWQYPNGWAPHQNLVMQGLSKYGYGDDALRIAKKYTRLVEKNFAEKHNLWEKYNVVTGGIDVTDESPDHESNVPPMMGWSAGAYLEALLLIEHEGRNFL